MFLKYINLPVVPTELLHTVSSIITNSQDELPKFTGFDYPPLKLYPITDSLLEWIKYNIPITFGKCTHMHAITDELIIHKDFQTDTFKLNYIFDTGGENVLTHFYDDDYVLLESHKVEPYRWHQFNGQINHNVTGVIRPRIAITLGTNTNLFN